MSLTAITITMTDEQPNGQIGQGTVTATLSEPIQNGSESVDPTPVVGTLNAAGQLVNSAGQPLTLLANDDTGTQPAGSFYSFTVELDNAPLQHFDAVVSHAAPGATVDLTSLREQAIP